MGQIRNEVFDPFPYFSGKFMEQAICAYLFFNIKRVDCLSLDYNID